MYSKKSPFQLLLFLLLVVSILFSCGRESDKNIDESKSYNLQIDTVLINSHEQPLFLSWNLSNASLSTDSRYLYNLNISEPSLEKIDLDQLNLVEKVKLEKEGPDGIGNNGRGGIVSLDEKLILFNGYPAPIVMTTEGKKTDVLKDLITVKKKFSDLGKDLLYEKVDPNNLNMVYGILIKFPGQEHELGTLNLLTNDTSRLELPEWKMLADFSMICNNPDYYDIYESRIFLKNINGKIVLGSNISSSLYVLDINQNKLEYITIDHQLTKPERTNKLPKEVNDSEEFFSLYKKTESEISFGEPVWDATNGHYFRLSHINHFETSTTGYSSPTKVDTYLNILDKNFKLQAEIPLPSRKSAPSFYFAKDGKLWIFENMDDEMGFVRIKVD